MAHDKKENNQLTLHELERKDWYLWALALLIIVIYALCIIIVARPDVWHSIIKGVAYHTFIILVSGLFVLTILLCIYLVHREHVIKNMRKELIRYQQMKNIGTIASRIAHDMNNDLTVAMGITSLLLQSDQPEETRNDLLKINAELKQMASLSQDLLAISRLKTQKAQRPFELLKLNNFIGSTLQQLENQFETHKIIIKKEWTADIDIPILGDQRQLFELFSNLFKNAIDAMAEGAKKELSIRCAKINNKCIIAISDTGCGFSAEALEHIFEPFFTTKALGHGTGIGLYIAKTIVESHKGKIEVKNNPAGGATVNIELPLESTG